MVMGPTESNTGVYDLFSEIHMGPYIHVYWHLGGRLMQDDTLFQYGIYTNYFLSISKILTIQKRTYVLCCFF